MKQLLFDKNVMERRLTADALLKRAEKFFGAPDTHCKKKPCEMCELGTDIRAYLGGRHVPQV